MAWVCSREALKGTSAAAVVVAAAVAASRAHTRLRSAAKAAASRVWGCSGGDASLPPSPGPLELALPLLATATGVLGASFEEAALAGPVAGAEAAGAADAFAAAGAPGGGGAAHRGADRPVEAARRRMPAAQAGPVRPRTLSRAATLDWSAGSPSLTPNPNLTLT